MNDCLDELAEVLDQAKNYGGRYLTSLCPSPDHDDTKPSFFVFPDWSFCKSCDYRVETSKLLEELSGVIIVPKPRVDWRNPWTKWLKDTTLKDILKQASQDSPSFYLRQRGIPDIIQKQLKLGMIERSYVTFPLVKNKKIEGAVARAIDEDAPTRYIIPSGQDPNLLYIPLKPSFSGLREVFLTFGILDAISMNLAGLPCVSTTTGKQLDPTSLEDFRCPIYIVPDLREDKEAYKLANKLGWRGNVLLLDYPEGTKDANDVWVKDEDLLMELVKEKLQ